MTKKSLRVAELDFDAIKRNLKTFLQSQSEFTDYNFEGSGLSILIDLLAYNTHYNAVIANMLVQEMYLDTAVKKESLALIAKRLGYIPKGYISAKAKIKLEIYPDPNIAVASAATIFKGTAFTAYLNDKSNLTFITRESYIANLRDGKYTFDSVEIYEGTLNTYKYRVDGNKNQRFEIPSRNVDISSVRVYVQSSSSTTETVEWKYESTIVGISSESKCFFIKQNESLKYEVYFGDNNIGKYPDYDNVVILEYITTNGIVGNNISEFTYSSSFDNSVSIISTTLIPSIGGNDPESQENIRANAHRSTAVQNRAVVEQDYETIINGLIPLDSIRVYGGETTVPPKFGKVFICLKQSGTQLELTETQKTFILDKLKHYSVLSLTHEIVDPEYLNIIVSSKILYDETKTSRNTTSLHEICLNRIIEYSNTNLNRFDSKHEHSRFSAFIDSIDDSIRSNLTSIKLYKKQTIHIDKSAEYIYEFGHAISKTDDSHLIQSNSFRIAEYPDVDLYITDVNGNISLYNTVNDEKNIVKSNVGTIDYDTGYIHFSLKIAYCNEQFLSLNITPREQNVNSFRNNILVLNDQDIHIQMERV